MPTPVIATLWKTHTMSFDVYIILNTDLRLHHLTTTPANTCPARRTPIGRGSEEPAETSDAAVVIREKFILILVD